MGGGDEPLRLRERGLADGRRVEQRCQLLGELLNQMDFAIEMKNFSGERAILRLFAARCWKQHGHGGRSRARTGHKAQNSRLRNRSVHATELCPCGRKPRRLEQERSRRIDNARCRCSPTCSNDGKIPGPSAEKRFQSQARHMPHRPTVGRPSTERALATRASGSNGLVM